MMRRIALPAFVVALTVLAACGSDGPSSGGGTEGPADVRGTVTVLAAASLTDAFTDLAGDFEHRYPGTHVELSFAGTPALVAQIEQGAPADVFAAAEEESMDGLVESGLVGEPLVFASNRMEIVLERGNPEGIFAIGDLTRPGLVVVLCDASVPCGRLADEVLDRAGVTVEAASREQNARSTLAKVELGEADAAIVYASDARTSHEVLGLIIPDDLNVTTSYPIAVIDDAPNASAARAFVEFVGSSDARPRLERAGFLEPLDPAER